MKTIALLTISNIFMTFAWYGHLKYREVPLYKVIIISWLIAFFEYCFQGPREPHRLLRIHRRPTKNNPGSDHANGLRRVLGPVSEAATALELPRRLRPDRGSGRGDLQKVVAGGLRSQVLGSSSDCCDTQDPSPTTQDPSFSKSQSAPHGTARAARSHAACDKSHTSYPEPARQAAHPKGP